jgi:hypothetical protein
MNITLSIDGEDPEALWAAGSDLQGKALAKAKELGRTYRLYYWYHHSRYVEHFATLDGAQARAEDDLSAVGIRCPDGQWVDADGHPREAPDTTGFPA